MKDESLLDRFDRVFAKVFKGSRPLRPRRGEIPEEWLRKMPSSI